jgi:uncharacterized protein YcfJ
MELNNLRTGLIGLLAGALAVGGTTALVKRDPVPVQASAPMVQSLPVSTPPAAFVPGYSGPVYDAQGRLLAVATPATPAESAATPVAYRASDQDRVVQAPAVRRSVSPAPRTVAVRKPARSTRKSAVIVAGSAGTGAAIGAIAGGGKGAAIGALSGGAAGFIYDRLTHNR